MALVFAEKANSSSPVEIQAKTKKMPMVAMHVTKSQSPETIQEQLSVLSLIRQFQSFFNVLNLNNDQDVQDQIIENARLSDLNF